MGLVTGADWCKSGRSNPSGNCVEVRATADPPQWRKSPHSFSNGNCVEVAGQRGTVLVRDSKDKTGPVLRFTPAEWRALVRRLR